MKHLLLRKLGAFLLLTVFCFAHNMSRGQSAPNLGAASSFAVFTAAGAFTNDGATYIIGDIGTNSPGALTGFPPGVVVGQIHVADAVSAQAAADVDAAYSYLSGVACDTVIGTTLGNNQVLTPNVYCLGAAATLNGNLILDAEGDPNALFIFKIDGALSTSTFSNIILVNGASLCNVYFQVNGAVSLGEGSEFRGILLVNGAISILEAASLYGQALSRAGAVDLHNNYISIGMQPEVTIVAGGSTTICAGDSVVLTASVSNVTGRYTYLWSPGGETDSTITVFPTTTTQYIVTVNSPNGCGDGVDTIVVTVGPSAIVDAGPDQTICLDTTVTLAGSIGGSATVGTYTGGSGTFSPNNTTLNAEYTPSAAEIAAGSVTLVLTTDDPAGACTAAVDSVTITISPSATADAGADQTICVGSSVTLAGSVGASATGGTYTGGTGTFSPNNTTLNAEYTPSAAEIAAGSVMLVLTTNDPPGSCGPGSDTVLITISPSATADAGPDQIICAGSSVTLAGSVGASATGGMWSGGTGTFSPNNTTLNAEYTPSAAEIAAGSVTLVLTTDDPAGSCAAGSDSVTIIINPGATVDAGAGQVICAGSSVTLSGSVGGSATGGTYTGGSGTFSPNNTTLNAEYTPSAAEIAAGSVVLTLTTNDPAGPCPAVSDTVTIIINPAANVNAGPDQVICPDSTATLSGSIGGTATVGMWSGGTGMFSPNNTTLNAEYTPSAAEITAGSVTLVLTTDDPAGACAAASDSVTIIISPGSTANAGPDQIICEDDSIILSGSVGGAAAGGVWSGGTGMFSPNDSTLNAVYIPSAADIAAGSVVLTLTTYGGCAPASDQVTITINPNPALDLGPDTVMCGCITLTAGSPSLTIVWSTGVNYPSITVCTGGTYWVTVSNGLCIVSDTITIIPPFVDLGNDTTITGSIVLDAGHFGSTFMWNTGDTTQTITVTVSGTYIVTVTDTMECTFNDTINITVGTGINEFAGQLLLDIYPNPNSGIISLEYFIPGDEQGELVIYDIAGRIVLRSMLEKGFNHATVSAAGLDNGTYFCRLISDNKAIAQKKMIIIK